MMAPRDRLVLLVVVGAAVVSMASCGGPLIQDHGDDTSAPLTVDQALDVAQKRTVDVQGYLVVTGQEAELCAGLAESYPPQCAGVSLGLTQLDPADVVGLQRPVEPDLADTAWTDVPLEVRGIRTAEGLEVTQILQESVSRETAGLRVRLAYSPDPLRSPGNITWLLDVTDALSTPLTLTFSDGQMGEVVLRADGQEVYRWSEAKTFTQAVTELPLAPGETRAFSLPDELTLPAGVYDVTAWVTTDGPALPQVETEVEILGPGGS